MTFDIEELVFQCLSRVPDLNVSSDDGTEAPALVKMMFHQQFGRIGVVHTHTQELFFILPPF